MLQRSKICGSLKSDRPVVSRPTASLDPSPLQRGSADSDLAIPGGHMQRPTIPYPWALAFWLALAAATTFVILAHALTHGGVTLT